MNKPITLLLALAPTVLAAQTECATAMLVGIGTHQMTGFVGIPPAPLCTGGTPGSSGMWYRYFAQADMSMTVTTDLPVNVGRDTRVHIYAGPCSTLQCIGGDDDGGSGYLSVVTVGLNAGTTYYIVFDNYWDSTPFEFELIAGPPPPPPVTGLTFTSQNLAPSTVWAVVDMNDDQLDDLVRVLNNQVIIHEQLPGGGFNVVTVPTPPATYPPSWSLAAGDIDGNGWTDLMYGAGSGVSFMLRSHDGTSFSQQTSTFYIFSQRTNMVDLNNDGHLDAFVCHDVDANVHFLNDGQGNLTGQQGAMGLTCGNYGSIFTDIDNDGLVDCFVAKCGCDAMDLLLINNGNLTWTNTAMQNAMADAHQSWSSAWGDFDNDGDMDVLIGSSSSSYHKLMRNDGSGNFTNVTANSGFHLFSGTSIEWTTHDFDNDGNLDVMGGGIIMMGNGDMTFNPRPGSVNNGPVGDINNDGFLDFFTGGGTALVNDGNNNHWIKVHTQGTVSNRDGIGARVVVVSPSGTRIRDVRSGDGFRYMSSITTHVGIGADETIDMVIVYWPSGIVQTIDNPAVDQTLLVVESLSTEVTTVASEVRLDLFPNPAGQWIYWSGPSELVGKPYEVFDLQGRRVLNGTLRAGPLDVSGLVRGTYVLRMTHGNERLLTRFLKD